MLRRVVLLAAAAGMLAALASCVSPEEIRRHDEARCAGYGFKPGTPDFATCLQREALARRFELYHPYWGPPGFRH